MLRTFISLLLVLVTGCASIDYSGKGPDLSLKGSPEANSEYAKFKLTKSSFGYDQFRAVKMGEETHYTLNSLKPVIADVSPSALEGFHKARVLNTVGLSLLGAAIVFLFTQDWPVKDTAAVVYYGTLIGSVGVNIWAGHVRSEAIDQYNSDLRTKLSPGMKVGFQF